MDSGTKAGSTASNPGDPFSASITSPAKPADPAGHGDANLTDDGAECHSAPPHRRPGHLAHPIEAHLVIYRTTADGIEIIRILHAHQNLSAYLQD